MISFVVLLNPTMSLSIGSGSKSSSYVNPYTVVCGNEKLDVLKA